MESLRDEHGKLHFYLSYPQISESLGLMWKQSSNPLNITDKFQEIEGFEIVNEDTAWIAPHKDLNDFFGLR